jgi:hypothetical protein
MTLLGETAAVIAAIGTVVGNAAVFRQARKNGASTKGVADQAGYISDQVRPQNGQRTGQIIEETRNSVRAMRDTVNAVRHVLVEHLEQSAADRHVLGLPPLPDDDPRPPTPRDRTRP